VKHVLPAESGIVTQSAPHVKKGEWPDQIEERMGVCEQGHQRPGIGIKEDE